MIHQYLRAFVFCLVLSAVLTPLDGMGQTVRGAVTDDFGRPLASATVLLRSAQPNQLRYGTTTGPDGSFLIDPVRPGSYVMETSFVGFEPDSRSVPVLAHSEIEIQIRLTAGTVPHPEVVVAAGRGQDRVTPVTVSNITAGELRARPDMKDLPATLSTRPSTTYYSENGNGIGYSTLRIRGFDQRRIAVSINGIPQNDPEDFNVFWINFFDIDGVVEDIQVQRGAGASLYGSTGIGGAINIAAMPYRPRRYAEVSLGYGSFDTRRASIEMNSGLLRDRYVLFGRYSRLQSDGYRDGSWSEFHRFFAGVTRYGDRSRLTLQAYGGPQKDGLAFSGIPRDANEIEDAVDGGLDRRFNASATTGDTERFHQPHVELHHEWTPLRKFVFSQTAFWVRGAGYFDFGANFRSAEYLRLPTGFVPDDIRRLPLFVSSPGSSVLFRANLDQWQVGWLPRLRLMTDAGETTVGAEARIHRSERWGRIQEATGIPEEVVGSEVDRKVYRFRGEKRIRSLFVRHAARPIPRIALLVEVSFTRAQYRVYDEDFFDTRFAKPYVFFNPRLGVTFNPERTWSAFVSAGYSSREPRLKSLYDGEEAGAGFSPRFGLDEAGNLDTERPLIDAEHLLDIELGISRTDDRSALSLNAFWMDFIDEIVPSGGLDQFGVPRTGNADRTRHVGLEAEWRLGLFRRLGIYGNFTVGRATYRRFIEFGPDGEVLDRSGHRIPGFPDVMGNIEVVYRRGGLRSGVYARYVGRQYIDNSDGMGADGTADAGLTVDPYVLADLSTGFDFGPGSPFDGLSVSVDLNNLLDRKVLLFGNVGPLGPQFFPAATRHVLFRATYTLR